MDRMAVPEDRGEVVADGPNVIATDVQVEYLGQHLELARARKLFIIKELLVEYYRVICSPLDLSPYALMNVHFHLKLTLQWKGKQGFYLTLSHH